MIQPARIEMAMQLESDLKLCLRPVDEADIGFLRCLYGTTRNDVDQLPWSESNKNAFLDHQFQAQHFHYQRCYAEAEFCIVTAAETPVGRLYVDFGESEFRIIDIAILPEYRNRGIGTRLLKEILDRATREHVPVRLRVEPNNPALDWYSRLGFEKIADEQINLHLEWNPPNSSKQDG